MRSIDAGTLPEVQRLAERIRWAIKEADISDREASRRAKLNPAQISLLLARLDKNPNAEVTLPMLLMIARGLGVVDAWLLTGRGDPRDENAWGGPQRPALAELPGWSEQLRLAQERAAERGRRLPDWAWSAAGACVVPLDGRLTALIVYEFACCCAELGLGAPPLEDVRNTAGREGAPEAPIPSVGAPKATGTNG